MDGTTAVVGYGTASNGGAAADGGPYSGGGGGGAGGSGNAASGASGGSGGLGVSYTSTSSITGAAAAYGGGGGGGVHDRTGGGGGGGSGGGGTGNWTAVAGFAGNGTSGTDGTGGGGGGGGGPNDSYSVGGNGGSGIVIVRYVLYAAPGAPAISSVTPGNQSLSVAFTAPASDGGNTITNYEFSTDGGSTWTVRSPAATTSPLTIGSLANGQSYQVQLRAVNAAGAGTASTSTSGTPRTVPGAPTGLSATPGDGLVSLSWTAPAANGSAITDYVVQYRTSPSGSWTTVTRAASTALTVTVTGLVNRTAYDFQVAATNAAGTGAYSTAVTSITPRAALSFTTGYSSVQLITGVAMAGQTPVVAGGLAAKTFTVSPALPTGLTLDASTGAITGTATGTSALNSYTVTVADGSTSPSATSTFSITVQSPMVFTTGYTTINQAVGSSVSARTPVVSNGFGTKSYAISPALPTGMTFSTSTGVVAGTPSATQTTATTHTITVTDAASPTAFTTTATISVLIYAVPGAPSGLAATPSSGQVSLEWTAPGTNGSAITDYVVQYRVNSPQGAWTTFADGTSTGLTALVTGLTNTTAYDFQVAAVNTAGTGAYSTSVTSTPRAALALSGYSSVQLVTGTAMASQTPTVTGGLGTKSFAVSPGLPTGLTLSASTGVLSGTATATQSVTAHTVTVTDATTGQTTTASLNVTVQSPMAFTTGYTAISQAVNSSVSARTPVVSNGFGAKSFAISPALPTGMTFNTTNGVIGGTPTATQTTATAHTVTVTDGATPTAFTSTATVSVLIYAVPDAPSGLSTTPGSGQVSLSWSAPAANGSAITDYVVQYRTNPAGTWTTFVDGTSAGLTALVTGLTNTTTYDFQVAAVNTERVKFSV